MLPIHRRKRERERERERRQREERAHVGKPDVLEGLPCGRFVG
jgi:hypothetical protein